MNVPEAKASELRHRVINENFPNRLLASTERTVKGDIKLLFILFST